MFARPVRPTLPNVGASFAAHDAALVRCLLLVGTLPGVGAAFAARFAALACWVMLPVTFRNCP